MNKKFFCFYFLVLTVTYASSLKLTNLCKDDVFSYQEVNSNKERTVNSFFRQPLTKELPKVKHFMVTHLEEPSFLTDQDLKGLKTVKRDYEKILLEVYSERFIDHLYNMEYDLITKRFDDYKKVQARLDEILSYNKAYPEKEITKTRKAYFDNMKNIENVLFGYVVARKNMLSFELQESYDLATALNKLHEQINDHQVPIFESLFLGAYYEHPIAKVTGFKLDRASKMFFSPESNGTINIELVIPFENKNYETEIKKSKCVKTSESQLPLFFIQHF